MQRWSFGIQRELPHRLLLEVSYVGNRGSRLEIDRTLNAVPGQYLSRSPVRDDATINFLTHNIPNPFTGMADFTGSGLAGSNVRRRNC